MSPRTLPNGSTTHELGYSSQGHFITDFKQVTGKTPRQYKKDVTQNIGAE
jgi:AraC-like DNA-binding protein